MQCPDCTRERHHSHGGSSFSLVNICAQSVHEVPADRLDLPSSPNGRNTHESETRKSPCLMLPGQRFDRSFPADSAPCMTYERRTVLLWSSGLHVSHIMLANIRRHRYILQWNHKFGQSLSISQWEFPSAAGSEHRAEAWRCFAEGRLSRWLKCVWRTGGVDNRAPVEGRRPGWVTG